MKWSCISICTRLKQSFEVCFVFLLFLDLANSGSCHEYYIVIQSTLSYLTGFIRFQFIIIIGNSYCQCSSFCCVNVLLLRRLHCHTNLCSCLHLSWTDKSNKHQTFIRLLLLGYHVKINQLFICTLLNSNSCLTAYYEGLPSVCKDFIVYAHLASL